MNKPYKIIGIFIPEVAILCHYKTLPRLVITNVASLIANHGTIPHYRTHCCKLYSVPFMYFSYIIYRKRTKSIPFIALKSVGFILCDKLIYICSMMNMKTKFAARSRRRKFKVDKNSFSWVHVLGPYLTSCFVWLS